MARHADRINDPYHAIDFYSYYLSRKDNYKIRFRLAELFIETRDYKRALNELSRLQNKYGEKHDLLHFRKGQILKSLGLYDKAVENFSKFRNEYKGGNKRYYQKRAKLEIAGCELFTLEEDPKERYEISHIEGGVNRAHLEFSPAMFKQNELVYGSLKTDQLVFEDSTKLPKRKFYLARKNGEQWLDLVELGIEIPKDKELGSFSFNTKADKVLLSLCELDWQHRPICEIYESSKSQMGWTLPKLLPEPINTSKSSSIHPSFGWDPKKKRDIIYFVSDRKGGKGGLDIWYSRWNAKRKEYENARNAGSKINSSENERTPFYDLNNASLYFSSEGHPSLGGFDVFSSMGNRSRWTKAKNLGKSFNTSFDELDFRIYDNQGFFVSNRTGTIALKSKHCCDDVFEFRKKTEFEKELVVEVYELEPKTKLGESLDSTKAKRLLNFDFELSIPNFKIGEDGDEQSGESESLEENQGRDDVYLRTSNTGQEGKSTLKLDNRYNYRVSVDNPRYFYSYKDLSADWPSETHELDEDGNPVLRLYVSKFSLAEIIIPNIYYPFDKYYLTSDAKTAIDTTVYEILLDNPNIIIEIASHTDSKGSFNYNINLSNNRAKSVANHLRKRGISKERLSFKGCGEGKPLVSNTKADGSDDIIGRAKNRRTSFRVIGILEDGEKILFDENFGGIKADR